MGLFKSGKSKADDLLTILVPALRCEIEDEIRRRLIEQMNDVVQTAAQQVLKYSYSEAMRELQIDVRSAPKPWRSLTDEEISEVLGSDIYQEQSGELQFIRAIEAKLREKNI